MDKRYTLRRPGKISWVRGILSHGVYLPYRRLDLAAVAEISGGGGRRGHRTVASFDEDATTMAVEAGRASLRSGVPVEIDSLWFATVSPPYLDKTNAAAIHAALCLERGCPAYDTIGSVRGSMGAVRAALAQEGPALTVAADVRVGLAGGPDEAYFGDGAAALLVGADSDAPVLAEAGPWVSVTDEVLDRWRTPGDLGSKVWEERYGELRYVSSGVEAFEGVLKRAGLSAGQVDHLVITGTHGRACRSIRGRLGVPPERLVDDLAMQVGNTGAAHPYLLVSAALEKAGPGEVIVLLVLADGAEALVLNTTTAISDHQVRWPLAVQLAAGAPIGYGQYLAWRGLLAVEPPRRPEPARVSGSAAGRRVPWKFGFVGSRSEDGTVNLPPLTGELEGQPMAEARGTVTTFTIDRLSYTPSPPMVFAVVDFDGGGRLPVELTDADAADVRVGDRVEMTFRRLSTADGIHNYFWKARPLREGRA
jgi:3-hydroxy-3-methylglutaryl CoA synthase